jgi:hypothetical protein
MTRMTNHQRAETSGLTRSATTSSGAADRRRAAEERRSRNYRRPRTASPGAQPEARPASGAVAVRCRSNRGCPFVRLTPVSNSREASVTARRPGVSELERRLNMFMDSRVELSSRRVVVVQDVTPHYGWPDMEREFDETAVPVSAFLWACDELQLVMSLAAESSGAVSSGAPVPRRPQKWLNGENEDAEMVGGWRVKEGQAAFEAMVKGERFKHTCAAAKGYGWRVEVAIDPTKPQRNRVCLWHEEGQAVADKRINGIFALIRSDFLSALVGLFRKCLEQNPQWVTPGSHSTLEPHATPGGDRPELRAPESHLGRDPGCVLVYAPEYSQIAHDAVVSLLCCGPTEEFELRPDSAALTREQESDWDDLPLGLRRNLYVRACQWGHISRLESYVKRPYASLAVHVGGEAISLGVVRARALGNLRQRRRRSFCEELASKARAKYPIAVERLEKMGDSLEVADPKPPVAKPANERLQFYWRLAYALCPSSADVMKSACNAEKGAESDDYWIGLLDALRTDGPMAPPSVAQNDQSKFLGCLREAPVKCRPGTALATAFFVAHQRGAKDWVSVEPLLELGRAAGFGQLSVEDTVSNVRNGRDRFLARRGVRLEDIESKFASFSKDDLSRVATLVAKVPQQRRPRGLGHLVRTALRLLGTTHFVLECLWKAGLVSEHGEAGLVSGPSIREQDGDPRISTDGADESPSSDEDGLDESLHFEAMRDRVLGGGAQTRPNLPNATEPPPTVGQHNIRGSKSEAPTPVFSEKHVRLQARFLGEVLTEHNDRARDGVRPLPGTLSGFRFRTRLGRNELAYLVRVVVGPGASKSVREDIERALHRFLREQSRETDFESMGRQLFAGLHWLERQCSEEA